MTLRPLLPVKTQHETSTIKFVFFKKNYMSSEKKTNFMVEAEGTSNFMLVFFICFSHVKALYGGTPWYFAAYGLYKLAHLTNSLNSHYLNGFTSRIKLCDRAHMLDIETTHPLASFLEAKSSLKKHNQIRRPVHGPLQFQHVGSERHPTKANTTKGWARRLSSFVAGWDQSEANKPSFNTFFLCRRARQVNRSRQWRIKYKMQKIAQWQPEVPNYQGDWISEKHARQIKAAKRPTKQTKSNQKQTETEPENTNQTTLPALCTGSITRPSSLSSGAPWQHSDQSHRSFSHRRPSKVLKPKPGPANNQLQNRHIIFHTMCIPQQTSVKTWNTSGSQPTHFRYKLSPSNLTSNAHKAEDKVDEKVRGSA